MLESAAISGPTEANQTVRSIGRTIRKLAFFIAVGIMGLALIGATVMIILAPNKAIAIMPAITILLAAALNAFLTYVGMRLFGSSLMVFADLEQNTRQSRR